MADQVQGRGICREVRTQSFRAGAWSEVQERLRSGPGKEVGHTRTLVGPGSSSSGLLWKLYESLEMHHRSGS